MRVIRDFIYLDILRLLSFDSQLFEGVAESKTRSQSKEANLSGSVTGKVPLFAEATADTKAVLAAGSSVTVAIHQDQLVVQVIDGLRDQGFLWDEDAAATAPDGAFVLLSGQAQIIDPESLGQIVEGFPDLMGHIQALQETPQPQRTPAERRAGRKLLRAVFTEPEALRPTFDRAALTEEAARRFAELAGARPNVPSWSPAGYRAVATRASGGSSSCEASMRSGSLPERSRPVTSSVRTCWGVFGA